MCILARFVVGCVNFRHGFMTIFRCIVVDKKYLGLGLF